MIVARDFAPNYTPRLRLRYQVGGKSHAMTARAALTATFADAETYAGKLANFLNALKDARYTDWTPVACEWAEKDSDSFLPVGLPVIDFGTFTTINRRPSELAEFWQFVGRGLNGSKGSLYVYGLAPNINTNDVTNDYRILGTEDLNLSAGLVSLSEVAPGFYAIDGSLMNWYPYVNVKSNDRWVHKIRVGG